MNSKEYQEIKDLLVQLSRKIDALYGAPPAPDGINDFELETFSEKRTTSPEEQLPKPVGNPVSLSPDEAPAIPAEGSGDRPEPGTVGDLFTGLAQRPTLADSLAKSRNRGPLREIIPLNDKFLYLKVLFSEDHHLYEKTLSDLQSLPTMQDAEKYLALHFPTWELSSPAVQKFLSRLEDVF
ncbi:MAG: hypothetical protein WC377_03555 [Bacteroidales bacterium]|nr:hypothetical protein [Bacteroidales bacterium]MDD2824200.1 hypothetical protein [Bacteroidales bacterium]MDD3100188.1 hypothetical protein [Bacteroidales bacterium]MDD3638839.1 hypothetical protein [Bacteroidales bacterium]MDD3943140.1 hypothetical protein [Bacteroidales bacterium]